MKCIAFVNAPDSFILPEERVRMDPAAIWSVEIARRLARSYEVYMYGGTRRNGPMLKKAEVDGVRYRGVPAAKNTRPAIEFFRFLKRNGILNGELPYHATGFFYPLYALRAALDIGRRKCSVIHVMNYSNFIPVLRAFNPKAMIVLHMHCEWLTQLDPRVVEKRLAKTNLVLGCSDYIARKIRNRFPETEGRCFTVWSGTDAEFFSPKEKNRNAPSEREGKLLFVSRVSPEKGVHVLLKAFEKVRLRYPRATLDIIGELKALPWDFSQRFEKDGPVHELSKYYQPKTGDPTKTYADSLTALIPDALKDSVRFHGGVPYDRLPDRYRNSEVFVYPSIWNEPFGMPVVEAMACGIPAVCSYTGAIPEILEDGLHGLLTDRNDPDALAGNILRLLDDSRLYERLSKNGPIQARTFFSWDRAAETLLSVYRIGDRDLPMPPKAGSRPLFNPIIDT